jgi:hypothetical protein
MEAHDDEDEPVVLVLVVLHSSWTSHRIAGTGRQGECLRGRGWAGPPHSALPCLLPTTCMNSLVAPTKLSQWSAAHLLVSLDLDRSPPPAPSSSSIMLFPLLVGTHRLASSWGGGGGGGGGAGGGGGQQLPPPPPAPNCAALTAPSEMGSETQTCCCLCLHCSQSMENRHDLHHQMRLQFGVDTTLCCAVSLPL